MIFLKLVWLRIQRAWLESELKYLDREISKLQK
jgi:hypothetical protein